MNRHREQMEDMVTLYPQPRKTPWQQSDTLDLTRTAVLVIDELGGAEPHPDFLDEMVVNSVRIVDAARAAAIPVVFCNDAHIPDLDRELELWGDHALAGTESAKPLSCLQVQEGDLMIPKRRYDAFFQTDLDLTLRELGCDTLIVVGCDTNICVQHTLAGAYFRGYRTIVPGDATATFLVGDQELGLEYFTRCYDSRVVSTDQVIGYLG